MTLYNRRAFLKSSIALAVAGTSIAGKSFAAKPKYTTIIEIANFHCSRCRAVNDNFERVQKAALAKKIDLVFAPAAWEGQTPFPNRVYYSLRDLYPAAEPIVRDTLFSGIHDEGQPFETLMQVVTYFDRKGVSDKILELYPSFTWAEAIERAESNEPLYSEIKAGQLIELGGVEEVPTFLWLGDAKISHVISPRDAPEAGRIVSLVVDAINKQ